MHSGVKRNVRCVVASTNPNGEPDLYFVIVRCTQEQFEDEAHRIKAAKSALAEDYGGPMVVFDEEDDAGKAMMDLFVWETASIVNIDG